MILQKLLMRVSTRRAVLFSGFFFLNFALQAQTPVLQYAESIGGSAEHGDFARDLVTDAQGNIYLTGIFHETVDFDPSAAVNELVSTGDDDIFLAKYNASGALVWVRNVMIFEAGVNTAEERPAAITLDETGNLYIIAESSLGLRGTIISKWSPDGNEIWTKFLTENNPASDVFPLDILASSNSLKISGNFRATIDFDPSDNAVSLTAFNTDGFILSLDYDGNFQWVKAIQCNAAAAIGSIETDSAGNIYAAGVFQGAMDLNPSAQNFIVFSNSDIDNSAFLAKYTSQGNFVWGNPMLVAETNSAVFFNSVVVDTDNNIIVAGPYVGELELQEGDVTVETLSSAINTGTYLAKYAPSGVLLWGKSISGTAGSFNFATDVNTDSCNSIYLSGEFRGNCDFDPSAGNFSLVSDTNTKDDVFLAGFTGSGDFDWAMQIGGDGNPDFVEINSHLPLLIDKDENIVVAGTFVGTMDFDPSAAETNLTSINIIDEAEPSRDFFLAKYSNPSACSLGIDDQQGSLFRLFPNPASGSVNVAMDDSTAYYDLVIYDSLGKIVRTMADLSGTTTVDISQLQTGLYYIKVQSEGKVHFEKLLVR